MSSSRILKDSAPQECSITPYCIREMDPRKKLNELEESRRQAEEILKTARLEKESIEMQAYNQGLEQGQAQGQKMAIKRIEPLFDTLSAAIDELARMRVHIIEENQKQIFQIIVLIAEKIIHRSVQINPDIVLDTIRAACTHLMETDEIRLRLHPSDFEYIREIEKILSRSLSRGSTIHFVEDTTLERGGVIIETEFGEIDASIRSQIEHMQDVLVNND
ncbi:MAG: FliH/SctL family protein [Desulfomonilia bacterium]